MSLLVACLYNEVSSAFIERVHKERGIGSVPYEYQFSMDNEPELFFLSNGLRCNVHFISPTRHKTNRLYWSRFI